MAAEAILRARPRRVRASAGEARTLSPRACEALALAVIGGSLFAILALATFTLPPPTQAHVPRDGWHNLGGIVGYAVAHGLVFVFGHAAYLLVLGTLGYALLGFVKRGVERLSLRALGLVVLTAMVALLIAGPSGLAGLSEQAPYGAGGRLGANLSPRLTAAFGGPGRVLVLIFGALFALLLATDWLFLAALRDNIDRFDGRTWWRRAPASPARAPRRAPRSKPGVIGADGSADAADEPADEANDDTATEVEDKPVRRRRKDKPEANGLGLEAEGEASEPESAGDADADADAEERQLLVSKPPVRPIPRRQPSPRRKRSSEATSDAAYPFPSVELFREAPTVDDSAQQDLIERNARAIERRLAAFKIDAHVVGVSTGPAVTQYELALAEGIKVSRVTSFDADLAAALKAVSVRVVAPIPGRDTVGIEVPNAERQVVVMRELLEQFGQALDLAIPLFLGKDVGGEPIVEDLARMPHLLIAGTTGSGKSVCINAILLSILMTRTPQQVRLILIDPKMVELQHYRQVPHLACEVVTNMKKAPGVLEWAVEEMEKRYARFSAVGVNHIRSYNKLGLKELEQRLQRPLEPSEAQMPYMVLVIDELADLMAVGQSEVEESIQRLAQKSRAVGLHVILATQRPSTDVITGVIKANLPCQIAFKVNRKIDSRVILDANGAEKLLGHGDMLYVPPGAQRIMRAQGAFVADEEIARVVGFLAEKGPKPAFIPDLVQTKTGSRRSPSDKDDLYDQAVDVILGQQRGSATLLQRALAVGYTRATRLLELMEEDGLVGAFNGSKSREVLITLDEWKVRQASIADALEGVEDAEADQDGDDPDDETDSDDEVDAEEQANETERV